jgi:uncharacterized protein (DUF1697 family)
MVGRAGLTRAVLLDAFERCGAPDASSFLATANVVFEPRGHDARDVALCVSSTLRTSHGLEEPVFVRSMVELERMRSADPFAEAPKVDVYERCVTFFDEASSALPPLPLSSARGDVIIFSVGENAAYSVTQMINGRTGTAGKMIEDLLATKATTRNWNTVERLLQKFGQQTGFA